MANISNALSEPTSLESCWDDVATFPLKETLSTIMIVIAVPTLTTNIHSSFIYFAWESAGDCPSLIWAKAGYNELAMNISLQGAMWAFGGSVPCIKGTISFPYYQNFHVLTALEPQLRTYRLSYHCHNLTYYSFQIFLSHPITWWTSCIEDCKKTPAT